MSEAVERFAALLQLSDKFLARAEREDLEECARVLAVQCAHYQSKFGKLPITDTLEVLSSETMNDEQATVEQAEKCLAENARLARRLQRLLLRTGLLEGRTLKRMLRGVVPRNITDWTKAAARPLAIDERLDTILRMAGGFALQVIGAADPTQPAYDAAVGRAAAGLVIEQHSKAVLQISGGQDSLACLYLLRPWWDRITVMWMNTGADFPETIEQMSGIREMVPHFIEVKSNLPAQIALMGWPADVVPVRNTAVGKLMQPNDDVLLQPHWECCAANRWAPAHQAVMDAARMRWACC